MASGTIGTALLALAVATGVSIVASLALLLTFQGGYVLTCEIVAA